MADYIAGQWRGALIRGSSGAGKSTLALRCIEAGFRLVADDRVIAWASVGRLFGKAPPVLAGLIEVWGVGVVLARVPLAMCEIDLIVDLVAQVERMPEPECAVLAGVSIPRLPMPVTDAALPLRLRVALAAVRRRL